MDFNGINFSEWFHANFATADDTSDRFSETYDGQVFSLLSDVQEMISIGAKGPAVDALNLVKQAILLRWEMERVDDEPADELDRVLGETY